MVLIIDSIFFFIFTITSLFWWLPVLIFLFLPFYILRMLKRKLSQLGWWIADLSDRSLSALVEFKKLTSAARQLEKRSKAAYNSAVHRAYRQTVWWTRFEILQEVPRGARVLDIGCGSGYLAKMVAELREAQVTCLDVVDYNETELETILFDGATLPFTNQSFDVVILSYVLHHSQVPDVLLAEAHRVCSGKVIIYEDEAPLAATLVARIHQITYNWFYEMDSPVTYRSTKEWENLFREAGFRVNHVRSEWQLGALTKPIKKVVFVLKPGEIEN